MAEGLRVRAAEVADAAACAAVYTPYVLDTAITFETEPPTIMEMAVRIAEALDRHAWFVLEDADGKVVGYSYGHQFARRAAYAWTAEVSVYIAADHGRQGGGRLLYEALLARLVERGYRQVMAGMTLPNPASAALHTAFGFTTAGTLHRVGWKHGHWHDVARLQLSIGTDHDPPPPVT